MISNNLRSRLGYALGQRAAAEELVNFMQIQGLLPGGNVYWASSTRGSDSTRGGLGSDDPRGTLESALGLCTASNGDTVILMPGHNEGMGDDQWGITVAGVTVLGLGYGSLRPRFDFDHANASLDIAASNVRVSNIRLLPSVTAVLVGIDINTLALNTELYDVEVLPGEDGAGVDEFVLGVDLKVGVDGTKIRRLKVRQHASAAGCNAGISLSGASNDIEISDSDIVVTGAAGVAPIKGITTLSTNVRITDTVCVTDDEPGIELLTGTTGVIKGCTVFSNLATINAAIVADGCALDRNFYIETGGESGAQIGTASVDD